MKQESTTTTTETATLLPCPFCKSKRVENWKSRPPDRAYDIWCVFCHQCSSEGPEALDEVTAARLWNTRAPAPQPVLDAGEWRVGEQGNALGPLDPIYPIVDAQTGKAVALAANPKDAAQIVSDHRSAAAVPGLVEALQKIRQKAQNAGLAGYKAISSYARELQDIEDAAEEALSAVQGKEQG
jgi:hypothetical protein